MLKENWKAFENYENNANDRELDILNYMKDRLEANKEELKELISLNELSISYENILEVFQKEIDETSAYKKSSYWVITPSNFMHAVLSMPIGIVGIETTDTLISIQMWLKAIKTHNAIVIIDEEYNEYDVKHFILTLLKISIEKFGLNPSIIDRVPYEESIDSDYQKIIKMKNSDEYEIVSKEATETELIYVEDEYFKEEVSKNQKENVKIIRGSYEEALKEINEKEYKAVAVYTQSPEIAYKAINEIVSEKVYINSSLQNTEIIEQDNKEEKIELTGIEKELYIIKNIIFPFQNASSNEEDDASIVTKEEDNASKVANKKENVPEVSNKEENISEISSKEEVSNVSNEEEIEENKIEVGMVKYEKTFGILEKIKGILRKLFNK